MSEAEKKDKLTLTPYSDENGSYYSVLGVTASQTVLVGQDGKTQAIAISNLKAGDRVIAINLNSDGEYELGETRVTAKPVHTAKTTGGRAGNVGTPIATGMGRMPNV